MPDLHEFDKELLKELSEKAVNDHHFQLALEVIAELNQALQENRPLNQNFEPILGILMAALGAHKVDVIRFVSRVTPRSRE